MIYNTIRFNYDGSVLHLKAVDVKIKRKEEGIKSVLIKPGPAVFVVVWTYLKDLLDYPDTDEKIIIRKKGEDSGVELYRLFPQIEQVPLLAAYYQGPGRLKQVVGNFLRRLHDTENSGHGDFFFLGVRKSIFQKIWNEIKGNKLPLEFKNLPDQDPEESFFVFREDSQRISPFSESDINVAGHKFLGDSEQARDIRKRCARCAMHDESILLIGESGTGKGVIAHDIHNLSRRRNHNFVTINCGSIPESIFESLIFGIKPGIASSVDSHAGKLKEAHRGTLFLDEIADLPKLQQVKLLNFIQDRIVIPVGGTQKDAFKVDTRIIAATNRELDFLVKENKFREDLYMRLRVILIRTPPLREQKDAIPILAQNIWRNLEKDKTNPHLPDDIIRVLSGYGFPGNYRELQNILTSLRYHFDGEEKLTARHIRELLDFYTIHPKKEDSITDKPVNFEASDAQEELSVYRLKCLRTLKHAAEWIRAMELTIEPFIIKGFSGDGNRLIFLKILPERLHELEKLFTDPLLYLTPANFETINGLKAKLTYLAGLLEESQNDAANRLLNDEIVPHLKKSTTTILQAVSELLKGRF